MNARSALSPGEPVGGALRDIAAGAVAQAQDILNDPERDPTAKVHDIRRALKRWRALLRMMAPHLGEAGRDAAVSGARPCSQPHGRARRAIRDRRIQRRHRSQRSTCRSHCRRGPASPSRSGSRPCARRTSATSGPTTSRKTLSDYLTAAAWQVSQWDLDALTFSRSRGHAHHHLSARASVDAATTGARPRARICTNCAAAWSSIAIRWN